MTDQASAVPPPIPTTKPKSWRWLKIIIAILFVLAIAAKFLAHTGTVQLEIKGYSDGVNVMNVGVKDITITGVSFNDHPGCSSSTMPPRTLKVGEAAIFVSRCQPTQVEIETDQGSETYSLQR
jgi:hypothetical protein